MEKKKLRSITNPTACSGNSTLFPKLQVLINKELNWKTPPGTFSSFAKVIVPPSLSPSGVHVFGLLATALVTDVIQLATGYHAPFFLTVCQPNYTAPGVSCDNNAYITQDICMGKDQYAIMSAR